LKPHRSGGRIGRRSFFNVRFPIWGSGISWTDDYGAAIDTLFAAFRLGS
jgi:hypothetical protein